VYVTDDVLQLRPRAIDEGFPASKQNQTWGWAYQILPYLELQNRWKNPDADAVRGSLVPYYQCPTRQGGTTEFGDTQIGTSHYVGNTCSNCTPGVSLSDGETEQSVSTGDVGWGSAGREQDGVFVQAPRKPRTLERITDGLTNTVFVAEKRVLASAQPCNNSTGWVSGYPAISDDITYGHDTLFSGLEGSPASDERDSDVQCTSRAGGAHLVGGNVLYGCGSVRFVTFGVDDDLWRAQLSVANGEDIDLAAEELISP
jgi:hypothetical protein